MRKVQFFDTTLRDGEQTPGVNFNTHDKVRIALQLEKWGVDCIEAGFPVASPGDFEAVNEIAKNMTTMTVCGLARCHKKDIDAAYKALEPAKNKQIHVFLATSPIHMEYKLKMTPDEVLASIAEHVAYAKTLFDVVQFSPEDATRTEREFLLKSVQTAVDHGATIINVPDTVGYTTPSEYGAIFRYLLDNIDNHGADVIYSSHCHDDLGMATSNSLAAIENGATRIEGTVNGIGERAGNTPIEECATALHIRRDFYNAESSIVLVETKNTSDLVSALSGLAIPKNKAIIGSNAFAHESGIHQDGVLKNPETYEIITPQLVGFKTNHLPLGKLSGRHAFATKMAELGYYLEGEELKHAFDNFKILADKKKVVEERDLLALMGDAVANNESWIIDRIELAYDSFGEQEASVSLTTKAYGNVSAKAVGAGSVEAIYNTIDKIYKQDTRLTYYTIDAVTDGIDAQAQVNITVQDNKTGKLYNASGLDYDVIQASAKAYIKAKELVLNEEGE
ncbi:MAG: 2-isopropylmalate synthase [Lactobacillales bacterium]|jgi:2-isopropylmalate synthase|nr:2-isopropylmalate synthase [Lactobacillales bacterium]